MNYANCFAMMKSKATYTSVMRPQTNGCAMKMKEQQVERPRMMIVNHISLESEYLKNVCLITVMLMGMKPEMDGGDDGVLKVKDEFLAFHVAVWDFHLRAISGCHLRWISFECHHDDGDYGAYLLF